MEILLGLNLFILITMIGIITVIPFILSDYENKYSYIIVTICVGAIFSCGYMMMIPDDIIEGKFELVNIDSNLITSSNNNYYNFHIYDKNREIILCSSYMGNSKIIEILGNETQYVILKQEYSPEIFPLMVKQSAEFYIHVEDDKNG